MCIFPQANAWRFPILSTRTHESICVSPGFHIGLFPHFTLGFAGVPPLQGSLSYWLFAELCRGIVFVKCVWGVNGFLRSFVFLYLIVLFVILGGLFVVLIVAFGQ